MKDSPTDKLKLRRATRADVPALNCLMERATRVLGAGYYDAAQIESGVRHIFQADLALIDEGTQFVTELGGKLVGTGAWSQQGRLFLGELPSTPVSSAASDGRRVARLRMFFVEPDCARRGIATHLFAKCAADAEAAGFNRLELLATLPGEPLYRALGFQVDERVDARMPDGVVLGCVRMSRGIGGETTPPAAVSDVR
jgi:N-acetylglutamate synthase-like GNAT family acetyltransferase